VDSSERIPVFVRIIKGRTVCICHAGSKRCRRNCERAVVERDRFKGWEQIMRRDRFGH